MPIDKMIPRFLVSDEDERLLKEGAMTDALNVTISEDGDGSEGVVKNVKGTSNAVVDLGLAGDFSGQLKVIGQVSDSQLGFIYFFVASVGSGHTHDAIYRLNTSDDSVELVFKNEWLNFSENSFLKADVVNSDFQQDGNTQSVLFFTDNVNPPRKINAHRAILGDYNSMDSDGLDYSLNAIKAAQTIAPSFHFTTNENFKQNNFLRNAFQFATQLIYTDGEESAISPYSRLAYSVATQQHGNEDPAVRNLIGIKENTCNINLNWSNSSSSPLHVEDVSKIRLLGRYGDNSTFFVIDEFDPSQNLTRYIRSGNQVVYEATGSTYKFYNDGAFALIDTPTQNKLYDNVPLLAGGQCVSGNRLMYSNYKEGFENNPVKANLNVQYSPVTGGVFVDQSFKGQNSFIHLTANSLNSGEISVELLPSSQYTNWPGTQDIDTVIPAGTVATVAFRFDWNGLITRDTDGDDTIATDGFFEVEIQDDGGNFKIKFGHPQYTHSGGTASARPLSVAQELDVDRVSFSVTAETEMTISELTQKLADHLVSTGLERTYRYRINTPDATAGLPWVVSEFEAMGTIFESENPAAPVNTSIGFASNTYGVISWKFDEIDTTNISTDCQFTIKPYISGFEFDTSESFWFDASTSTIVPGIFYDFLPDASIANQTFYSDASNEAADAIYYTEWSQCGPYVQTGNTSWSWDGGYASDGSVVFSYINHASFFASASVPVSTLKFGCDHDFGVVYYDKFNRSGNVNKLGSVSVAFIGDKLERNINNPGKEGPAILNVDFVQGEDPPEWATRWQLVYGGMSTYEKVFSYVSAGGYVAHTIEDGSSLHQVDESKKQVYVSLKNLDQHKSDKTRTNDYEFEQGDILRVVSYEDSSGNRIYPMDNRQTPQPIEFNVSAVKVFSTDHESNTLYPGDGSSVDHVPSEEYVGTFLVLDSPAVNSGVQTENSVDLKYRGFDWQSVSGNDYLNDSNLNSGSPESYWGRKTVIEILRPRKNNTERVYYEVGSSFQANGYTQIADDAYNLDPKSQHGPAVNINIGDVRSRLSTCKTPIYDVVTSTWTEDQPDKWEYKSFFLEDQNVSDAFASEFWDKGRAHVVFERSAEVRRASSITYSDAYEEDVAKFSLSSFNPSLANFKNIDYKFGKAEFIGNYNEDLVCLQENKLSLIPINKNILEYTSGSADVAVSENVIGQPRYSAGDYGSGGHPESVLVQDSSVYFVDESRQAVCVLTNGQLVPISEKGMSSFFEGFFSNGHTKYVSGYDPRDNTYYLTGLNGNDNEYKTIGYDAARGVWQSRYSFQPDVYSNQNNMLYSAKYASGNNIFWKHENTAYNTFYGTAYPSTVQVVSKLSPSNVKVFNAISYEGDLGANWDMSPMETDLGQTSGTITSFTEDREGSYYAAIPRDTSSNSTSQYLFIGVAGSVSSGSSTVPLTSSVRINRLPANAINLKVFYKDASGNFSVDGLGNRTLSAYTSTSLTLNLAPIAGDATDKALYVKAHNDNGDVMRGHYAKIKLTNNSNTKHELYCINTHITDSKSHHPLGQ